MTETENLSLIHQQCDVDIERCGRANDELRAEIERLQRVLSELCAAINAAEALERR